MISTSRTAAQPTLQILQRLYRLNQDSELGFETVAEHVKNRGLKIFLKSYAQQRAHFAAELLTVMADRGWEPVQRSNPLASLHRGWIDLKAAMTIGRESVEGVVLSESVRGETAALRAYREALRSALSDDAQQLLRRQAAEIERARIRLSGFAGQLESQLVVQLFDNAQAAEQAMTSLANVGIAPEQIQLADLTQMEQAYQCNCQRRRVLESSTTGLLLGLMVGAILGALSGMLALVGEPATAVWTTVATTTGAGLLGGGVLGGLLGVLIGQATTEDDAYLYGQSLHQGDTLMTVEANEGHAREVRQLLSSQHRRELAMA
jgi:uncharacterized protein (TIGR02284 family)